MSLNHINSPPWTEYSPWYKIIYFMEWRVTSAIYAYNWKLTTQFYVFSVHTLKSKLAGECADWVAPSRASLLPRPGLHLPPLGSVLDLTDTVLFIYSTTGVLSLGPRNLSQWIQTLEIIWKLYVYTYFSGEKIPSFHYTFKRALIPKC